MTAETSNARGEWVLVPREPTPEMRQAYRNVMQAHESATFTASPDDQWDAMLAAAPPPAAARGDVRYDRELIAQMLDAAEAPAFTMEEMDTQARLLREAAQAKPEARGVVDEVRSERAWPAIGNLYLVKIGGVLQHEVFMFDQGDCEPGGSAPPFWSRDGLDYCPEFDPHKDQWISLDEIDAALTGERNG